MQILIFFVQKLLNKKEKIEFQNKRYQTLFFFETIPF